MNREEREIHGALLAAQKKGVYTQRAFEALERLVDERKSEVEVLREQMSGEICVRQSELDDIAEIVGVQKDAPYAAVRDRVAELARAGDQLRMAT